MKRRLILPISIINAKRKKLLYTQVNQHGVDNETVPKLTQGTIFYFFREGQKVHLPPLKTHISLDVDFALLPLHAYSNILHQQGRVHFCQTNGKLK